MIPHKFGFGSLRSIAVACLALRIVNALLIRTTFSPDEYWQSLEVAHRIVFGYGHLTWEWAAGIRSYLHPLIFAVPLQVAKWLGVDSHVVVLRAPQLLQAAFAASTDVYVYRLALQRFGPAAAGWTLIAQLASWFNAYCLVRTVSSSLEALATVAALYHLQSFRDAAAARQHVSVAAMAAALGVVIRPPSLLFWLLPGIFELWRAEHRRTALQLHSTTVGSAVLAVSCIIDRVFYGRWLFVPWEFAKFNLLGSGSTQYGAHPWHWNLTQGLPTVAATLLPLALSGLCLAKSAQLDLAAFATWSLAVYSMPAHKEFRFLLPALQLLMPYCGVALAAAFGLACESERHQQQQQQQEERQQLELESRGSAVNSHHGLRHRHQASASDQQPGGKERQPPMLQQRQQSAWARRRRRLLRLATAAALLLQLPAAAYFGLIHQRGTIAIMSHLARQAGYRTTGDWTLFLTPCHATPWYSHLHRRLPMRFLDCSPPGWAPAVACLNPALGSIEGLNSTSTGWDWGRLGSRDSTDSSTCGAVGGLQPATATLRECHRRFNASAAADAEFRSERQQFEVAPAAFLQQNLPWDVRNHTHEQSGKLPKQIVLFDDMLGRVAGWAQPRGYLQTNRFAHADSGVDGDRQAAVVLLERP